MAGAALDRELTRQTDTRFALATPGDDEAIRRLLRDNPMQGSIRLTFEREPDYFAGTGVAGADDETIVAFSRGRLVCMGRCTRRDCWVDGRATSTGYLAELRLDAAARGRFGVLRDGYRFFRERQQGRATEICFTSIASDNQPARRLLERGARGLPVYTFLAELATLLVAVPRRMRAGGLPVAVATLEDVPAVLRLLNDHARRHQLAAVWTGERLSALARHGLPLDRLLIARGSDGEIAACGALWDQRAFRQTVIRGYASLLAAARPLVNAAGQIFGTPRLPAPGSTLAHAFLSPLALADGASALLPDFAAAFFPLARQLGIEFLTLALPAEDANVSALQRRFSTRLYRSRLYRVDWPGETLPGMQTEGASFLPDVALL